MPDKSKNLPLSHSAVVNLPTPPPRGATDFIKAYEGWVYAGISTIAKQVSTIDLNLMRKMEGEDLDVEEIYEHESLSLIDHVNDFTTQNQLWEMIQVYLELTGEAFIYKMRGRDGKTDQLWVLRPDWMTIKPSSSKFIDHYIYKAWGMGTGKKLDPKNVIPFKFVNPLSPYRGKGSVSAAARAINVLTYAEEWNEAFFYNGAMPSMIMTSEGKLDAETVKRWKSKWEAEFRGAKQAHKIAFLGGGKWDIHEVSAKIREMDFVELQNNMRDQILGILGIPRVMVGSVENVNRATSFAAKQIFAENVVKPRMINIASTLTEFLLPDYETNRQLFFDFADPVPEDVENKREMYASALEHGWMTINEVRNEEGLSEVENGDMVYLPFNMQPVGSVVGKAKDAILGVFGKKSDEDAGMLTLPVMDKDGNGKRVKLNMPIPPKRLREIRDDKLKADIKPDLIKLIGNVMKFKDSDEIDSGWTEKQKSAFWKQAVARMDVHEGEWTKRLAELFNDQKEEVLDNLETVKYYAKDRRKGKESSFLFDLGAQKELWLKVFGPKIAQLLTERGRDVLGFLGIASELDLTHDLAVQYLEDVGVRFVTGVNETTRQALRETLAEGLAAEESITGLRQRVIDVFHTATRERAEMIARTEVSRATSFATNLSYIQSGVVEAKEWFTAEDERVCPFCNSMNGKIIDVNETYFDKGDLMEVDGQKMEFKAYDVGHPPLHPSCYDKETEIYTVKGWKKIKDVKKGERVFTLNPDNRDIEESMVINTIKEKVDEVNYIKNKLGSFDMRVSKNHPFFGYKRVDRGDKGREMEAVRYDSIKDLPKSEFAFYVSSKWQGEDKKEIKIAGKTYDTVNFVRFMGYYLSEGSVSKRQPSGYQISIAQKRFLDEMYDDIKGMPFDNVCLGKEKIYIYDQDMANYLLQFGKANEKYIPSEIKGLAPIYLKEFLDAYAMGDGTVKKGKNWKGGNFRDSTTLFTASKGMADELGEVIIKSGKSVSYKLIECAGDEIEFPNGKYKINHDVWRVNILHSRYRYFGNMEVKEEEYNDYVYDVEVAKNNTLLVRRNGRVYWGSNCRCVLLPVTVSQATAEVEEQKQAEEDKAEVERQAKLRELDKRIDKKEKQVEELKKTAKEIDTKVEEKTEKSLKTAKKKADKVLSEAKEESKQIVKEAKEEKKTLMGQLKKLHSKAREMIYGENEES